MRKQPNLVDFAFQTVIVADEVEFVDGNGVFALCVAQDVLLLVVELEGLGELICRNSCDFDFHVVFLILALILIMDKVLKGMEFSWARVV